MNEENFIQVDLNILARIGSSSAEHRAGQKQNENGLSSASTKVPYSVIACFPFDRKDRIIVLTLMLLKSWLGGGL